MKAPKGVFVYHPLGPKTPLFGLWRETSVHRWREQAADSPELLMRYRSHLTARLRGGVSLPDHLNEDSRELVRAFRAFFPIFLERIGAPPDWLGVSVTFPTLALFDARVVEVGEQSGIFVTSRVLDVIELFARTMSLCARLNGLAMPVLLATKHPPPAHILPAWLSLDNEGLKGSLQYLMRLPQEVDVRRQLEREIFAVMPAISAETSRAWGRHRVAAYLAQILLVAMGQLLRTGAPDAGELLGITTDLPPSNDAMSMDALYLATVVLTFVVLHEHGHIVGRHNSLEPMEQNPEITRFVEAVMQTAKAYPDQMNLAEDIAISWGNTHYFEQNADCFAIEVTPEAYRDAMLEAATLWFTALASADRGGTDLWESFLQSKGRSYPQYAMRVFFLNGRYSTGARQGEIALAITRTAEATEADRSGAEFPAENLVPIFRALWEIAREERSRPSGGWKTWFDLRWPWNNRRS